MRSTPAATASSKWRGGRTLPISRPPVGLGSSIGSGSARSDRSRRSRRSRAAVAPPPAIAFRVRKVSPPARTRLSSGSTSSAGGSEDQGGVEAPSAAKAKPPAQRIPAPAGAASAPCEIAPRPTRASSAETSSKRPAPRETISWTDPSVASAKPSRSGCSQQNQRSLARREANTAAVGSSRSTGAVTLTIRRCGSADSSAAWRSASRPSTASMRSRLLPAWGAQCSGRDLVIATSPVRAISISPWGLTMRSNESILSCAPVISIVRDRRETSTILPS